MISRETIDEFFRDNKRRGASLDRDMLWGYFFTGHKRAPLENMKPIVEALDYTYVGILGPSDDNADKELMHLHIERVEKHSAASLFRRCGELSALAKKHKLEGFDGFDVGNVDGSILFR
jgi:hypothetical protein